MLVAISIPIFSSQLEKSRDAVSVANMRSAYAEAQTAVLTGSGEDGVTVNKTDGKITSVAVSNVSIKSQKANEWSDLAIELPFDAPADTGANKTGTLTFTYDANLAITGVSFN